MLQNHLVTQQCSIPTYLLKVTSHLPKTFPGGIFRGEIYLGAICQGEFSWGQFSGGRFTGGQFSRGQFSGYHARKPAESYLLYPE